MPKRLTTHTAANAILNREPFTTSGSLVGGYLDDKHIAYIGSGRLPEPWREKFFQAKHSVPWSDFYVVYSYGTPIAWWTKAGGWTVPDVKYSRTTTKHQGNLYLVR